MAGGPGTVGKSNRPRRRYASTRAWVATATRYRLRTARGGRDATPCRAPAAPLADDIRPHPRGGAGVDGGGECRASAPASHLPPPRGILARSRPASGAPGRAALAGQEPGARRHARRSVDHPLRGEPVHAHPALRRDRGVAAPARRRGARDRSAVPGQEPRRPRHLAGHRHPGEAPTPAALQAAASRSSSLRPASIPARSTARTPA